MPPDARHELVAKLVELAESDDLNKGINPIRALLHAKHSLTEYP